MEDDQKAKKQMSEVDPALEKKSKELEKSGLAIKLSEIDLFRHLQAITDTARIVIRATDEVRMLEEVCRIIVEIGGYRLAWIGYAEVDNGKNIRPVAHKGFEDGYLDTVNISWAETERGNGPTGTAIRTGKTVIAQNILDQEGYAPWRNQALQRGYAASIAVPFIFAGTYRGALNVYATEPQAFDAGETKLMEELAENLAFGISTLRERTVHRQMEEDHRPWGYYRVLADESHHKVKRIVVQPGQRLSLQRHRRRSEHWYIVQGKAIVRKDENDIPVQVGSSVDIPVGSWHRISNTGADNTVFIEVQTGDYFGEDDIERSQDDYGRLKTSD